MDEEHNKKLDKARGLTFLEAVNFSLEFGFIIALPLVGLGFLGKWLNVHYGTRLFLPLSILIALVFSTVWLYKRIKAILNKSR